MPRPELLVSIRSVDELHDALHPGVAIVDVKEPWHGSLGAASGETIARIAASLRRRRPLSVALGELMADAESLPLAALEEVDYVKFGLAGAALCHDWPDRLRDAYARLPKTVQKVAVAYADVSRAASPPWQEVIRFAAALNCRVLLVDTYDKPAGDLWAWMSTSELTEIKRAANQIGLRLAVAGSLQPAGLMVLRDVAPEIVAVRSAVCRPARTGRVCRAAVGVIVDALAKMPQHAV